MSLTTPFSSKKEGSLESLGLTPKTVVLLGNDVGKVKEEGKRLCQLGLWVCVGSRLESGNANTDTDIDTSVIIVLNLVTTVTTVCNCKPWK